MAWEKSANKFILSTVADPERLGKRRWLELAEAECKHAEVAQMLRTHLAVWHTLPQTLSKTPHQKPP